MKVKNRRVESCHGVSQSVIPGRRPPWCPFFVRVGSRQRKKQARKQSKEQGIFVADIAISDLLPALKDDDQPPQKL